jgi:hypothetical protein
MIERMQTRRVLEPQHLEALEPVLEAASEMLVRCAPLQHRLITRAIQKCPCFPEVPESALPELVWIAACTSRIAVSTEAEYALLVAVASSIWRVDEGPLGDQGQARCVADVAPAEAASMLRAIVAYEGKRRQLRRYDYTIWGRRQAPNLQSVHQAVSNLLAVVGVGAESAVAAADATDGTDNNREAHSAVAQQLRELGSLLHAVVEMVPSLPDGCISMETAVLESAMEQAVESTSFHPVGAAPQGAAEAVATALTHQSTYRLTHMNTHYQGGNELELDHCRALFLLECDPQGGVGCGADQGASQEFTENLQCPPKLVLLFAHRGDLLTRNNPAGPTPGLHTLVMLVRSVESVAARATVVAVDATAWNAMTSAQQAEHMLQVVKLAKDRHRHGRVVEHNNGEVRFSALSGTKAICLGLIAVDTASNTRFARSFGIRRPLSTYSVHDELKAY